MFLGEGLCGIRGLPQGRKAVSCKIEGCPLGRGEVRVFPEEGPSVAWGAGIGCCDRRGQYCLWELEMLQVVGSQPSWVGGI